MLQPYTVKFLKQLKKNNNKLWFDSHKKQYLAAKEDFEELVKQIIIRFGKIDADIGSLQYKNCIFRIYRDVRFSKDKTPYKTHLAARFTRNGQAVHFPTYYLHIEPGGMTDVGGGIWRPDTEELQKVRQEIDYNYKKFDSIVKSKKFQKYFDGLEQEDLLSRPPKGYDEDNPAIEYLKLKSFFAGTVLEDKDLTSENLVSKITSIFEATKPLVDFLCRALD